MSEYTHTTSTTTRQPMLVVAAEPVTGPALLEAAYGGKVQFHKVRGTGTLRRWPVLAPGSKERKQAEALAAQVAAKQPVPAVAKAHHTSVATVRRTLVALAFTHELEAMSAKDRAALAKAATANGKVEQASKPAPAPKEQPKAKATPAPKEPQAKRSTSKPATGKGGFTPTTKAGKQAAARKAARQANSK